MRKTQQKPEQQKLSLRGFRNRHNQIKTSKINPPTVLKKIRQIKNFGKRKKLTETLKLKPGTEIRNSLDGYNSR